LNGKEGVVVAELLTNLVENNDSIKGTFRTRSKSFYEKTVHGKTASLAQRKAEIETQEGWEIVPSKLKKSVKLTYDGFNGHQS